MTEGVKASFYLRFCDVLGEDPSTAMRKIVDEGIKIDSEFVETLQKQQRDAEEALKAAKLLAAVSGDTFTDPGLDISMKDEYEKASKLLQSTEQLWETLQTEDFEALPTNDPAASQARPRQAEPLEEQIMRDMMGDAGGPGTAAASPSSSIPSNAKMSLYDQMDAMLGSISAGSFSSPTSNTAQSPSSPSPAAPLPPLRAPNRGQQSPQQQADRPTAQQPAQQPATAKPPPQLSSRPALGAASARDDSDEDELSSAELERRAVELEEELFPGLAGQDALLEADAVTVARERLQAVKSGKVDIGGGTMEGATLEERFPDLEVEGVTMEDLLAASKAQPRAAEVRPPPPPQQPAQPPPKLASRPQAPPPPQPTEAEDPAPASSDAPAPKSQAPKRKKKRASTKAAAEAVAAPPTPSAAAQVEAAPAPPKPAAPPQPRTPTKPENPASPEPLPQVAAPPKPKPAAVPESVSAAPAEAEKPKQKASNGRTATADTPAVEAVPAAAAPVAPRPPAPPEPPAAPDPKAAAAPEADTADDVSANAGDAAQLSPTEAAELWEQKSAETEQALSAPRPALRTAGRGRARELDDAIKETLEEAGKLPPAKQQKAALPKKRRKAQRGAAMKALDPETMSKLLTPSPVAAQQAQKAGFVVRRPDAAPITTAAAPSVQQAGDERGAAAAEAARSGEGGGAPVAPPSLSARPVAHETASENAEDAEGVEEAAAAGTASGAGAAAAGEPFYAMVAYASSEGAHVTFGDRQSGILPADLMSRHTAGLIEDADRQKAATGEALQPRLIRAVITDTRPDGTAVLSERGAYAFADVGTDAVSAALDPLIAEALMSAEARVEAYVWGPPDDDGGYPALFMPPARELGIAQALLDTSGLPQMEAYLVDERADRPATTLPFQTKVEARVCTDGLAHGMLKLTVLSTQHDALLRKLTFEDAAVSAGELPPETLRCLSGLARLAEVPAVRVLQLLGSPTPAAQPQLYIGKEEKDVDKGGSVIERCVALHCKHLIVSCAVQSTFDREQFMAVLQAIVAEASIAAATGPRQHE